MRSMLNRRSALGVTGLILMGVLMPVPATGAPNVSLPDNAADSAREEADRVLAQIPFKDELPAVSARLDKAGIFTKFPDVYGSAKVDPTTGVLTVSYDGATNPESARLFLDQLNTVSQRAELKIQAVDAGFSSAGRSELARKIATGHKAWAPQLGLRDIVGAEVNAETGGITVYTSEPASELGNRAAASAEGVAVSVVGSSGAVEFQSRVDDYAPWTGGARIRHDSVATGPAECTLGFTWRKNQSGELMGSTAEHCFEETGYSNWYNWGAFVGTRYYYSNVRDTTLLRGSPQSSFSASVFVGSATTSDIRDVNNAQPSPIVGGAIALSGGISGLTVGENLATGFYAQSGEGPMVRTSVSTCAGGDSGSPWLTTLAGSGDAVAHGQHVGRVSVGGQWQCLYMPVFAIASALTATIATR